jgi:hypothetical protein
LSPVGQWLRLLLFLLTTPCMSLMMTMTDLSPAAQAVLDAFTEDNSLHDWKHNHYNTEALAAALRAAALCCKRDQLQLLAIADELEGD